MAGRLSRAAGRHAHPAWSDVVAAIDVGVVVVDLAGSVEFVNPVAQATLGVGPGDVIDIDVPDTLADGIVEVRVGSLRLRAARSPIRQDGRVIAHVLRLVDDRDAAEDRAGEEASRALHDQMQQELVNHLQEAVRPPQPTVPGTDLGVAYLGSHPSEPTGGDLYDWYRLPDGDLHVVVVDVMGKGVAATKDALAVVHALRVLVLEGFPLDGLVARVDRLLSPANPSLVATLLVGRYTPSTGRMRLAGGGHPPMLLVSPNGEVAEVTAPGIPIGWPEAGSFEVVELTLDRSQTAVFYTDGLIEARRDIISGLANLKAAASDTASYPARHLPRILIERSLRGAQRRDDSLALVLRRRDAPLQPASHLLLPRFDHRFLANEVEIGLARHFLFDWLRLQGFERAAIDDLCVVASELCTNAVQASGPHTRVAVRAWVEDDAVVLEVEDEGSGLTVPLPGDDVPPQDDLGGRGLFVSRALVDDLEVDRPETGTGTIVRCRRRWLVPATTYVADDPAMWRDGDDDTDFSIDVSMEGIRTSVVIRGDVDAYSAPRLEQGFPRGDMPGRHVVVDLSGVTFIDSTGLSTLVRCLSAVDESQAVLTVEMMPPQVAKLFELSGFDRPFFARVLSAVGAAEGRQP